MPGIYPVILCGGTGTRLWPMSRSHSPKQFQPIGGPGSLTFFQNTVQRHRGGSYERPVIVTAAKHAETVIRQLKDLQCDADVIAEPVARNTGPAVLAAALHLRKTDPDALMLVLPSDHVIEGDLDSSVVAMSKAATDGRIVLFGITPAYPETGYGYITDGGKYTTYPGLHRVQHFVEKPDLERATQLVNSKMAYWASGISLFAAATIINDFATLDRRTFEAVDTALEGAAKTGRDLVTLDLEAFRMATNEPTERIVFENAEHVALAPVDVRWNDVGCWTSVHEIGAQDLKGNVLQGNVVALDTSGALVRADKRLVAVFGLEDVIVVDTPDAVLVTKRGKCQGVKEVVNALKKTQSRETVMHKAREFHWGQSEHLARSGDYDMSVIRINAGATVRINPQPRRQLFIMHDTLELFDGLSRRTLEKGESVPLSETKVATVTNTAADPVEALLLTAAAPIGTHTRGDTPNTGSVGHA